jgi:hypothetical protein
MVSLSFVLGSVDAQEMFLRMSSFLDTGYFHQLSIVLKLLLLWMFWITMELMPWNAKHLPKAFSRN